MKKISLIIIIAFAIFLFGCNGAQKTTTPTSTDTQNNAENTQTEVKEAPLKQLFAAKPSKYTVDYEITTQGEKSNMKMAMDGIKFAQSTSAEMIETKSIYDGQSFVSCTNMQNTWSCYKMTMQKPSTTDIEDQVNNGVTTTYLGTCIVAGENGLKYEIKLNEAVDKSTICYTNDGILLQMTTTQMTMTATKVQRSIDESMFTIPAEPKDLSTI